MERVESFKFRNRDGLTVRCAGAAALLAVALGATAAPHTAVAAPDAGRDLSVSFSSRGTGPNAAGSVVGTVENTSRYTYPCVRLQFSLSTRFDQKRNPSDRGEALGTLSVDVRDVRAKSAVRYQKGLPFPAGFGLRSVEACAPPIDVAGGATKARSPRINAFAARPDRVRRGQAVAITWDVAGADRVRLFADGREVQGRARLPNGRVGWPSRVRGWAHRPTRPTTYRLRAESDGASPVQQSIRVSVSAPPRPRPANVCSVVGHVSGQLTFNTRGDRGEPLRWTLDEMFLESDEGGRPRRASVRNRSFRFSGLQAGKTYRIHAWSFQTRPRQRTIRCDGGGTTHRANFEVLGPPRDG